jgi:hypothetical protein
MNPYLQISMVAFAVAGVAAAVYLPAYAQIKKTDLDSLWLGPLLVLALVVGTIMLGAVITSAVTACLFLFTGGPSIW